MQPSQSNHQLLQMSLWFQKFALQCGTPYRFSQNQQQVPEAKLVATHPGLALVEWHLKHELIDSPSKISPLHSHCAHQISANTEKEDEGFPGTLWQSVFIMKKSSPFLD
nr:hypothetical protein Iba_chr07cCG12470 [Ipomoea batatas]